MSEITASFKIPSHKYTLIIICTFSFIMSGCSTIYTQGGYHECGERCTQVPQIFSGTASAICCIDKCGPVGSSFAFIDAVFSFVADTIILPYTTCKQISEGSICKEYIEESIDED